MCHLELDQINWDEMILYNNKLYTMKPFRQSIPSNELFFELTTYFFQNETMKIFLLLHDRLILLMNTLSNCISLSSLCITNDIINI